MYHGRALAMTVLVALHLVVVPVGMEGQPIDDCDGRAALRISVVDDSGTIPIPNATVVLRWTESDRVRRPVRQEAGADGRLPICAPPDARQATLWSELGDASSEEASVALESGASHDVELRLLIASVETGRLVGQVRDARTEDPVTAAAVSLVGRPAAATTNRRGRFILSGIPVGLHQLEVRHIGYAPLTHRISVARGMTTDVEVGLVADPVELEPLVATAIRVRRLETKGFYERKYWGALVSGGTFFTAEDIERRNPRLISQMIADESGIRLDCGLRVESCKLVNTRRSSTSLGPCVMSTYLDGVWVNRNPRDTIDMFVRPVEIAGVEVYKGAASLPAEYAGMASGCGVVVIWTK